MSPWDALVGLAKLCGAVCGLLLVVLVLATGRVAVRLRRRRRR